VASSPDDVYRDYNVQGVPSSGDYKPRKSEIRALLKQIQNSGGLAVTRNTFASLSGVTPPNENYMGVVLTGAEAGYYSRVAGVWTFGRGFPDTLASLTQESGTNTVVASVSAGVDPSAVKIFFIEPTINNTGAVTLSISGGSAKPVLNVDGDALTSGQWPAGRMLLLTDQGSSYRLVSDPDVNALLTLATDLVSDAEQLSTPGDGTVSTPKMPDGAVTTPKVAGKAVTNPKLADVPTATLKGRVAAGTGEPADLTKKQARNVLGIPLFAPWVSNGHFGAGFDDLAESRDQLAARLSVGPRASGTKVPIPDFTAPGSSAYCGFIRMAEADSYFMIPFGATSTYIYRGQTKELRPAGGTYFGAGGNSGACLMDSGRIALAPYDGTSAKIYNPYTDGLSDMATGLVGGTKWNGCAKGKDGKIAFAPHSASTARIYDENGGGFITATGAFAGAYDYAGAVTLPDGKVLFVPHNETRAAVIDFDTAAVTFGASIFPGAESFAGGALINDHQVLLFPHKNNYAVIYDFIADTVANFPVSINTLGVAGFRGGVALADGRFWVTPLDSAGARILDLTNNTAVTPVGTYGSASVSGGALMDNGDVILAPFAGVDVVIAATGYGERLAPELLTSPHLARS